MASAESAVWEEKRSLRRAMKERRAQCPPDDRTRAAAAAGARLAALTEVGEAAARGACIAGFAATRGELDPRPALEAARAAGAKVAFPRVDDAARPRLRFHVAPPSALGPGRFGIDEPDAAAAEVVAADLAVMVVPGLAFDATGRRLGQGGGYYDEVLAVPPERRPRFVVGVGYDFQVVDACPADERDALVDCVVTEARVIDCRAGRAAGGGTP
jgi:5-formyltetrahydrofolate cyclo-ligase